MIKRFENLKKAYEVDEEKTMKEVEEMGMLTVLAILVDNEIITEEKANEWLKGDNVLQAKMKLVARL